MPNAFEEDWDDDGYEEDEDEGYEGYSESDLNIFDKKTRKPRVCEEKCPTCIFRPGNVMDLRSGRVKEMVENALNNGGHIVCHATLPGAMNPDKVQAAVCSGFFESFGHLSNGLRIFSRLSSEPFTFVKLEKKTDGD